MYNDKLNMYEACSDDPSLIFTLIKRGYFDVINELIDEKKIDVNICDSVGNDVCMRLLKAKQYDLVIKLMKKRNWNVNNYLISAIKFLEDKRFDNIEMGSLRKLYKVSIKNSTYGKYSKIDNLKIIVNSLDKKQLSIEIRDVVDRINDNMDSIKEDLLKDSNRYLDRIFNSIILETT